MRIKKEVLYFSLFLLAGVISRAWFASRDFTHMDGVLYAIGSFDFSIKNGTPPSPGYFIYIMTARLLNNFTHNPHNSLMMISIFYSGLITGTLYYFGRLVKGHLAGAFAAILFLTSPVFWYKGITIFGYLNSGFFMLLTALFCYLIVTGKKNLGFWMAFSFAVLLGVRQQELVVMLPLFIYALFHMKPKEAALTLVSLAAMCLLWFIPLVAISGGLKEYISVLKEGSIYLGQDSVLKGNFLSKLNNHVARMAQYFLRAYFLAIVPLVYYGVKLIWARHAMPLRNKKIQFFIVWLAPCIFYNIFLQFGEIGHGMSWGLGLFLIMGQAILVLAQDLRFWKGISYACVLGPIVAVNLFMFFYDFDKNDKIPFYTFKGYTQSNYNYVLKKNHLVKAKMDFIRDNIDTSKAIIITTGVFMHQALYYFPDSIVIRAGVADSKNRPSLWLCHGYKRQFCEDKTSFTVPEGYTKVVVFDEKLIPYAQSVGNLACHTIEDVYVLAEADVKPGQEIDFGINTIRIN